MPSLNYHLTNGLINSKNGIEVMPIQLEPYPTWSYQETLQRIQAIENPNLKSFAKIGYLLGGRISELLELSPEKIKIMDAGLVSAILRTRKVDSKAAFRELINVSLDEPVYVNELTRFKESGKANIQEMVYYSSRWIEYKLKEQLGTIPHGLRHLRATHMGKQLIPSKIHQPTALYLKRYFGWTKLETASSYIDNLTTEDIISHYLRQG